jgi:hypothetical protein
VIKYFVVGDVGRTKAEFVIKVCRILGKGGYLSDLICSRSIRT